LNDVNFSIFSRRCYRAGMPAMATLVLVAVCAQPTRAQVCATAGSLASPQPRVASGDATIRDGTYVLQVGDEISIKAFHIPDVEETVRIRPDGKISLVLLPEVPAAGLTTEELTKTLTSCYANYFQQPKISVIVRSFSNSKVFVGGEVGQPQLILLSGSLTALGAVLQAGGFKNTARTDSVILVRNDGYDHRVARRLNLKAALKGAEGDVVLKPFDVVYVPRSSIASLDKTVDEYVRQLIPAALTGGFTYLWGPFSAVRVP
jgi:protein involved in polysaccharide export with SLBB domain